MVHLENLVLHTLDKVEPINKSPSEVTNFIS